MQPPHDPLAAVAGMVNDAALGAQPAAQVGDRTSSIRITRLRATLVSPIVYVRIETNHGVIGWGEIKAVDPRVAKTLVIIGGEFGRTPAVELVGGRPGMGRDHNHWGFTLVLAGGGIKGGIAYGATDEFGYRAVEHPVHVHDLHATILHLLGFDHERLTYRYAGRDFRLTDVEGRVVDAILA